jgi:hypothetical protein
MAQYRFFLRKTGEHHLALAMLAFCLKEEKEKERRVNNQCREVERAIYILPNPVKRILS